MNTRAAKANERNLREEEEDYAYESPMRDQHERNRTDMSAHTSHHLRTIDEGEMMDKIDRLEQSMSKMAGIEKTLRDLSTTVNDVVRNRSNQNTGFSPGMMSTPHMSSQNSGIPPRQIPPVAGDQPIDRAFNWRETFGENSEANVREYIRRFEMHAATKNWTDLAKTSSFLSTLEGRARFITRDVTPQYSWRDVRQLLEEEWEPPNQAEILREKLSLRHRTTKETPEQYLRAIQDLAVRGYGDYPAEMIKDIVFRQFKLGQPDYIMDAIYMVEFRDVNHALNYVQKLESRPVRRKVHTAAARVETPDTYDTGYDASPVSDDDGGPVVIGKEAILWVRRAFAYTETDDDGYYDEEELYGLLRTTAAIVDNHTPQNICFFCRKPGHRWMKCYRLKDQLVRNGMRDNRDPATNGGPPKYDNKKPYTPYVKNDRDDKRGFVIKPTEN